METSDPSNSLVRPDDRVKALPRTPLLAPIVIRLPRLDAESRIERAHAALLYGGLLVLMAAVLRLGGIGSENLWTDEITMVNIGLGGWSEVIRQFNGGRPPAYVFVSYVWTVLFGTGEVISRLPSCFASILSVGVLFHLGARMFNQRVGFLAALVLVVTEFHIYYAQTDRYYAFYVLTVLFSYLFMYRMLKRGRWRDTVLYVVFAALALYTHAHGVFAIASQGIFFLLMWVAQPRWRNHRIGVRWLASQIMLALFILPGLWRYFLADLLGNITVLADAAGSAVGEGVGVTWLAQPTVGSIARALIRFLFFQGYYLNPYGIFTALLFFGAGTAFYISRAGVPQWGKSVRQLPHDLIGSQPDHLFEWALVISWFLGMLMLPWILSFIVTPMFYDRYVLGASPPYYLLLALVVFGIRRAIPVRVTTLAFLSILIPGLIAYYTYPNNEDWQGLSNYLKLNVQPGDAILVFTSDVHRGQPLEALNWYYPDAVSCELYEDQLHDSAVVSDLTDCLTGHQRAWIVGMRWQGDYERLAAVGRSGSLVEFFDAYDSGGWQLVEAWEGDPFYEMGLYLYRRGAAELK